MTDKTGAAEFLTSGFAENAGLADLVALYVDEMPARIEALEGFWAAGDWSALAVGAHQMKGSAGSHGFHQLTPYAAALEQAAREPRGEDEIVSALRAVVALCRRVR